MTVNAANTIVVLDDPISSFDSNFYYNAISYIREKTLNVGQTFIFTHKFALLKDFSMMFKERITALRRLMKEKNIDILIDDVQSSTVIVLENKIKSELNGRHSTDSILNQKNIKLRLCFIFLHCRALQNPWGTNLWGTSMGD